MVNAVVAAAAADDGGMLSKMIIMMDDFYVFVPREPCSSAAMAENDQQRMRWMEIG
jgi:hypothetical protein